MTISRLTINVKMWAVAQFLEIHPFPIIAGILLPLMKLPTPIRSDIPIPWGQSGFFEISLPTISLSRDGSPGQWGALTGIPIFPWALLSIHTEGWCCHLDPQILV